MATAAEVRNTLLQVVEILRKGWCRRSLARTAKGACTDVHSSTAVKFCPEGAIMKACAKNIPLLHEVKRTLDSHIGMPAREWNDWHVKNKQECIRTIKILADSLVETGIATGR